VAFRAEIVDLAFHLGPEVPGIDKALGGVLTATVCLEKIDRWQVVRKY
jgi:hypothetical protein